MRCLQILIGGEGVVRGRIEVTETHLGLVGSVHSGVFAAIAESLASTGTALAVVPEGHMALGLSNDTSVLEPVTSGTLHATARAMSRSDDAWVWTVDTRDREGRPCSLSRVTVAVRSA